ncbi:MAG: hypothetical protein KKF30_14840 [Proteobacteria bacterium]|nr:hypothetical protein [Pseudomonadota bacterium]MBU4472166.1 hypothetical protein [Pseudomonadota bacterium]MCG2753834.1 hypothetical protein [Desulfobacteraceae bacterium]
MLLEIPSGKPLKEIAVHFGIGASGVSQSSRRFSERMEKDQMLKDQVEKIESELKLLIMKS